MPQKNVMCMKLHGSIQVEDRKVRVVLQKVFTLFRIPTLKFNSPESGTKYTVLCCTGSSFLE